MLRSIGKQFRESMESVWKKKRNAMVGMNCRKETTMNWPTVLLPTEPAFSLTASTTSLVTEPLLTYNQ